MPSSSSRGAALSPRALPSAGSSHLAPFSHTECEAVGPICLETEHWAFTSHFPPSKVAGNSSFTRTFTYHRTIYPLAFPLCALHQTNHVVWNFPELRKDGKCGSGWSGGSAAQVGVSRPGWVWTGQRAANQSCDSCARPMVSEERHEYLFTSAAWRSFLSCFNTVSLAVGWREGRPLVLTGHPFLLMARPGFA